MSAEIGIGLDLSTASSGLFIVGNGEFGHGQPYVIKIPYGPDRSEQMAKAVLAWVRGWSVLPSWAGIEDVYLGENVRTLKKLVAVGALVESGLKDMGIHIYRGYTAQIDSACGISGHLKRTARKKATRKFAEMLYGKLPQDAADALCIAYWGWAERRKDKWLQNDFS